MFEGKQITVLIAEHDPQVARMCARIVESMHMNALIAYTIEDALSCITAPKRPSIMLLSQRLNGTTVSADVVLDTWISNALGPVAVICETITAEIELDLLTRGAYNALVKPFGPTLLQGLLNRYGKEINDRRTRDLLLVEITNLKVMVQDLTDANIRLIKINAKIKKWAVGFALGIFVVGGIDLLPYLKDLITLLF